VGDKIGSVVDRLFSTEPSSPVAAAAMRGIRTAHRFGLTRPWLALFPPLDDEAQWMQLLAIFVGVALELQSDDLEIDVDAARQAGREVLANLYADE
jgi:hypothetical protein